MRKRRFLYNIIALGSLATSLVFTACNDPQNPSSFEQKPITGISAMFDESLGYYNEHASVFDENNERYVYYTKNKTKNNDTNEYIAVRKATQKDGKWSFGDSSVALDVSDGSWDSVKVFQADVIKGAFTLNGENYSYLMAYSGTENEASRKGAQIGLAVAKSAGGPFVRVSENPFITWSAYDYSQYGELTTNGVCEPSLVNYNSESQVILFYSLFNPNTSYSCKYVLLDLSGDLKDLTARKCERGNVLSQKGISDMSTDPACISADFALSADKTTIFAVRDYYPISPLSPAVAEAVQVISAPVEILKETVSTSSPEWTIIDDKISSLDTAVWDQEDMMGYDRVYSACVIGNGYGYVENGNQFSIAFTSCALASSTPNYKYTPMIHEYAVE